ncbi:hypothetical protein AVEN_226403-1 [Araneus ventricosus]|uniref:Uncharacterized protein n=1 Tax=Araneus ventricosus TaxID=182803 RepID=A0A4Y2H0G9_ARAVE|nr:hypothetical protein AVEN_226403-1 [Araneus ventricosus]
MTCLNGRTENGMVWNAITPFVWGGELQNVQRNARAFTAWYMENYLYEEIIVFTGWLERCPNFNSIEHGCHDLRTSISALKHLLSVSSSCFDTAAGFPAN